MQLVSSTENLILTPALATQFLKIYKHQQEENDVTCGKY